MLGDRIKFYREKQGLSQNALAARTNVETAYICMLESNARNNPSLNILQAIARELKVSVQALLSDEPHA